MVILIPSTFDRRRLERAVKRVEELRAWRNAAEQPIADWRFMAGAESHRLQPGDFWPSVATPVRLAAEARIPEAWAGQPVELELWLGGEGLLNLSTGLQAGLDPFHHSFRLAEAAAGGERIGIEAEVVPKGMFGSHVAEPRIERAHLVVPQHEVRGLERDLTMLVEACEVLGEHEVVVHLLDLIDTAFLTINPVWPSATDVAVTRLVRGYVDTIGSGSRAVPPDYGREAADVHPYSMPIWHLPPAPRPLEPLPDVAVEAIRVASDAVAAGLERIRRDYPPVGRLALTGHAHLDLAWLWPVAESRRKGRRTFSTVLNLMDRYPEFTFNQSSAQLYAWIEGDDPALFARVRERIGEGRWEPVGGSWVEPDCQVTGGESFVRQLLYGQRYFQEKFGRRSTVAWLPDVFGFAAAIPQLLRSAGIGGFFTIKLTWNESDRFPHDLFVWEGLDGSRVTANMFRNLPPAFGYNGSIRPLDVLGTWRNFDGKRHHPESLLAFGWGDGAGGPTTRMLENFTRIKAFPALPRLRMAHVEEYFEALPNEGLPRWVGELYLEFHRGTFTTQAKVKELNRAAEHRLLEAEAFAALAHQHGVPYPHDELEAAWKTLLLNQFHDILPGSSIAEVYQDTQRELADVVATATAARDTALRHLGGLVGKAQGGQRLLVANAGLTSRPLRVLLPDVEADAIVAEDGEPLPTQATEEGLLVLDPRRSVPGVGWTTLTISPPGAREVSSAADRPTVRATAIDGTTVIENDSIRVEVAADGTLASVFDKVIERQVLAGRGNQLWAYVDKPRTYDAWDIEETYEAEGEEIGGVQSVTIVETGPLRAAVRVVRAWRGSRIEQTYRLGSSMQVDIATFIDWHERQMLAKARFPLALRTHEATYETMYGAVRRPNHRNTSWDAARFEVCAHRFADLSETGYGVALLNTGKYGHSAHDNFLTLSLVRSPLYPDPYADEGEHRFSYSLLPHPGDWTEADIVGEAFALNSPLIVAAVEGSGSQLPSRFGLLAIEEFPLALGGLKRAEDGDALILRLYEPHGARGTATLRFSQAISRVEPVDLLEQPTSPETMAVTQEGDTVRIAVRPFQVLTLRVE